MNGISWQIKLVWPVIGYWINGLGKDEDVFEFHDNT